MRASERVCADSVNRYQRLVWCGVLAVLRFLVPMMMMMVVAVAVVMMTKIGRQAASAWCAWNTCDCDPTLPVQPVFAGWLLGVDWLSVWVVW